MRTPFFGKVMLGLIAIRACGFFLRIFTAPANTHHHRCLHDRSWRRVSAVGLKRVQVAYHALAFDFYVKRVVDGLGLAASFSRYDPAQRAEIGRASCRERVWVAGSGR